MVEDKYIGLALATCSSLAIGTSFIITKKGLNDAGKHQHMRGADSTASDNHAYLRNPIWWAGISTLVVGEAANFAAYTFAPPILVTPLGALSVLIGAVLASFLLNESLGHIGRIGCALCLLGSSIIVLHAPEDKPIDTVDEILEYALHPGFMMYCFFVLAFSLFMIYVVAPKHGKTNPLVYISVCSLVGSVSVMAIKGFGIAVKLTLSGKNQFTLASTYVFGIVVVSCILVQMNYFNKALDLFSTNVVNPMYFVCFTTSTLIASLILFQGLNTDDATNTVSLLSGFIVTFLGVHLLNLSRQPEPPRGLHHAVGSVDHTALESGFMNPRMSLQGRMSIDGWEGVNPGTPRTPGHGRRSSLFRSQGHTLFNAFEDVDERDELERSPHNGSAIGLDRLRGPRQDETDDDDDDDDEVLDADERTHLQLSNGDARRAGGAVSPKTPSRNHSSSPSHMSQAAMGRMSPRV